MNTITQCFQTLRANGRKAFIPFLTAGDPDLAATQALLPALAEAGASLIELGFPFSDPIADGPIIQESYTRALRRQIRVTDIFRTTAPLNLPVPLVAMASYSLVWKVGPTEFVRQARAAGLAGAVVPDLPVEEAQDLARICQAENFALTLLVTPTTRPDRAAKILAACTGFVYVVSVVGITGNQSAAVETIAEITGRLRQMTDKPLCLGFGINTPEQVAAFAPYADGLIVGSALVKLLTQPDALTRLPQRVRELVAALPAPV